MRHSRLELDPYHQNILEKLFEHQRIHQTGLTRYVLGKKYDKIKAIGHATTLDKTKELENNCLIKSVIKRRKKKGRESDTKKYVITVWGVVILLSKIFRNEKYLGKKVIHEIVSSWEPFFPWMFANWEKLKDLYDEVTMFERFVAITEHIDIDYNFQKVSSITDKISNRIINSSEFSDPYVLYGNYLTTIFIHELVLNTITNTEHTVLPKDIQSGGKVLKLLMADKILWSMYKKNIRLGILEHSNELKIMEQIDNTIKKFEKN